MVQIEQLELSLFLCTTKSADFLTIAGKLDRERLFSKLEPLESLNIIAVLKKRFSLLRAITNEKNLLS